MKGLVLFFVSTLLLGINYSKAFEEKKVVRIASGSLLDGYYSIGLTLCRYITASNEGIKCEVVPTTGSLENIILLEKGEVDFAFTMSNLAVELYSGTGRFAGHTPFKEMYQLLSLHDQYFTVLVKDQDKILLFGDLEGKKISNGPPKSDSSIAYEILIKYYDFRKAPEDIEILHENYAKEFCSGNIDGVMLMTGHPNSLVNLITHKCETDFLTVENDMIDMLTTSSPVFKRATLKAGIYPGITQDQQTLAISSIFVTSRSLDKKIVENFLNYFNSRRTRFKSSDPVLYDIDEAEFTDNYVIPGPEASTSQ